MQHHVASSKRVGLTAEDWTALRDGALARFSSSEQAALSFAEKLTRAPWEISDADIAGLRKHFSEAQIVDLDVLVGLVNLTNRFTDPMGLEFEMTSEKF